MLQEEREICNYLKAARGEFISAGEISRRAGGKWRYQDNPDWALPVLAKLVEAKVIESDGSRHYRLVPPPEPKDRKKKWVSPHMKKILEKSGKDFTHIIKEEE